MNLEQLLGRKILVLDGAMGTQLLTGGAKGCLELLNVDNAAQVAAVHNAYLEAGADIITTNTTCADALCLAEYGLQERSYELARAGAELARAVADKYSTTEHPRLVAGSVGPTTRNLTLANDTTAEAMAEVYSTVIRGLIDGGVDVARELPQGNNGGCGTIRALCRAAWKPYKGSSCSTIRAVGELCSACKKFRTTTTSSTRFCRGTWREWCNSQHSRCESRR